MLIRQLLLITAGASYGLLSAAGVFTVLVAVGLIPRFAGKTHTARYVLLYEEMVIFGTLSGCFVTVFPEYSQWGSFLREALLSLFLYYLLYSYSINLTLIFSAQ